jgi:hypothetical protein
MRPSRIAMLRLRQSVQVYQGHMYQYEDCRHGAKKKGRMRRMEFKTKRLTLRDLAYLVHTACTQHLHDHRLKSVCGKRRCIWPLHQTCVPRGGTKKTVRK